MIELNLGELAVAVIGLAMVLVVYFEWVSRWTHANARRRAARKRMVCRLCLAVFSNPGHGKTADCPVCGARTDCRGPSALG